MLHTADPNAHECTFGNSSVETSIGFKELMADLQQTWKLIFVMLVLASIFSLLWVLLMRHIGGKIVWVSWGIIIEKDIGEIQR